MKKYLCVLQFPTGIAQLDNVGWFEAESEDEASKSAAMQWNVKELTRRYILVFAEDKLYDGWAFYE